MMVAGSDPTEEHLAGDENLQRMKTLDDAWNAQDWEVFRMFSSGEWTCTIAKYHSACRRVLGREAASMAAASCCMPRSRASGPTAEKPITRPLARGESPA